MAEALILNFNTYQVTLLKNAVKQMASMANTCIVYYTPEHVELAVTPDSAIVFFFRSSTDLIQYMCLRNGHGRVSTQFLLTHLDSIVEGDVVNVQITDNNIFWLIVEEPNGRMKVCVETQLGECSADVNNIVMALPNQLRALVEIPCAELVYILLELIDFGEPVSIIVKHDEVEFFVEPYRFYNHRLLRNDGLSTFFGVGEDDRIQLSLGQELMSATVKVAHMTERVGIYLPSPPDPAPSSFLLKFDIESMQIIVFLFTGR